MSAIAPESSPDSLSFAVSAVNASAWRVATDERVVLAFAHDDDGIVLEDHRDVDVTVVDEFARRLGGRDLPEADLRVEVTRCRRQCGFERRRRTSRPARPRRRNASSRCRAPRGGCTARLDPTRSTASTIQKLLRRRVSCSSRLATRRVARTLSPRTARPPLFTASTPHAEPARACRPPGRRRRVGRGARRRHRGTAPRASALRPRNRSAARGHESSRGRHPDRRPAADAGACRSRRRSRSRRQRGRSTSLSTATSTRSQRFGLDALSCLTLPCKTTRPRFNRVIDSHRSSTRSSWWLENNRLPPARVCSRMTSDKKLTATGSRPANGSSSTSSSGPCTIAAASCTRCDIPPDRLEILSVRATSRSSCPSRRSARVSPGLVCRARAGARSRRAGRERASRDTNRVPAACIPRPAGRRRSRGVPATPPCRQSGANTPNRIRMRVVFPAPFGPRRPITEPDGTSRSTPSRTTRLPNRWVMPLARST